MDCKQYNKWRRDIVAEYVLSTGRTFPRVAGNPRIQRLLVRLGDVPKPPSPEVVIGILRRKGFVK